MEKRLYKWFVKQRERNYPVNALALKEKAKEIHLKLKEKECSSTQVMDGCRDLKKDLEFVCLK